jgi:hypothetical protein
MSAVFVTLVPPEHVTDVWAEAEPLLERAVNRTSGRFTTSDVYRSITEDGYLLWIAVRDDTIVGAVVTFFMHYPRKKYLCVQFCGGKDFKVWKKQVFYTMRKFAADNGCDGLEAFGRLGWEDELKDEGYRHVAQFFEIAIDAQSLVTTHADADGEV